MKKTAFKDVRPEIARKIVKVRTATLYSNRLAQKIQIIRESPYSEEINSAIATYIEFRMFYDLRLKEAMVTRPALIKDIDLDLWVTKEDCTNRELMMGGYSPYAFDEPNGKIELHHLSQSFDAPFAELTIQEHIMNEHYHVFHTSETASWRKDEGKLSEYLAERARYWQKRASGEYTVTKDPKFVELEYRNFQIPIDQRENIKSAVEELFMECSVDDLEFLADLAKSYALVKQIGATSMSDLIRTIRYPDGESIQCPHCKSKDYVLSGTYKSSDETIQRYMCKNCRKSFSASTNSLISGSSFSYVGWIKFIDCLYNGYTIEKTAEVCGISERTAHDNRIKLFYALKLLDDKVKLQGHIAIDETYFPVSFKGQASSTLPREAHKRGQENHKKGLSKNMVAVVCALDDMDNSIAHVAGTGNSSARKITMALNDSIEKEEVTCLYSDKASALKRFAEGQGYKIIQIKRDQLKQQSYQKDVRIALHHLQRINAYHSRLKKFLSGCSSSSTKLLSGYLYLFAWKERNKNRNPFEAYKELIGIMTEPNLSISAEDIVEKGYLPDATNMKVQTDRRDYPNYERDAEIYRRFAEGESMAAIGRSYGQTRQNISRIINDLRAHGLAYKTKKEEAAENPPPPKKTRAVNIERDRRIFLERQKWTGTLDSFAEKMAKKYGISTRRVMNIVSTARRMERLKDEIFIYEDVTYRSREDIYREIYQGYMKIKTGNPNMRDHAIYAILAKKHNCTTGNIDRILKIMTTEDITTYFKRTNRLTPKETYKRDKALFIDYLKWTGTRMDFCKWAAEKYNLSVAYVDQVLFYIMMADEKRFDMV